MDYLITLAHSFLKPGFGIGKRNLYNYRYFYWRTLYYCYRINTFQTYHYGIISAIYEPCIRKNRSHLTGNVQHTHRNTTFLQQLWRGIKVNGRNLFMELLLTIPLLLLKFIPVINIFSTILLFLVQAYYAGFGNMDYTLERHFKYKESTSFVRKHRGLAIGNGMVFILFLLIPVIGVILVLPLSVTAATTRTVETLQLKNNLPNVKF